MSKRCTILSGGPYYPHVQVPAGDFVIACDLGYRHALEAGVTPDLVIGDFDSYSGQIDPAIPTILLPTVKNDTDTGYALRYAVEHGYDDVVVHYALGARLDHTLANLQSAAAAAQQGAFVTLVGASETVHVFSQGRIVVPVCEGEALSVLALSDRCRDVCVKGARYLLDHATLTADYPLGVSNQGQGDVEVSVGEGVLFVSVCRA